MGCIAWDSRSPHENKRKLKEDHLFRDKTAKTNDLDTFYLWEM